MSDLTEYDREIVAAAEAYVNTCPGSYRVAVESRLHKAVQAKRGAQRPKCGYWTGMEFCDNAATQGFRLKDTNPENYRCDEHRIEVREL